MKKICLFLINIWFASVLLANNKLPQKGIASYYSDATNHHRTACWDRYCKDSFTAAHRTLPFGTYVKVTNLKNGKSVVVRINDRGPHKRHRIIDLSGAAANALNIKRAGLAWVEIALATPDEIINFRNEQIDSTLKNLITCRDSTSIHLLNKIDDNESETYMVQGGAFKTRKSADWLKKYLTNNCVQQVFIKYKKIRRHRIYKVLIGPMNEDEKENTLKILKNKGISGWVIRS